MQFPFCRQLQKTKKTRSQWEIDCEEIENILKTAGFILFFSKKLPLLLPNSRKRQGKWASSWGNRPKMVGQHCKTASQNCVVKLPIFDDTVKKKPATSFLSQALGAPEGIRTPGTWRRRTKTGRYRLTLKREFCWLYTVTTQNKKKPVVGYHNRLFRHFEGRLHSSGQMVVNNPTHSHIFSAKKVL